MYSFLSFLLSDRKGGKVFTCFGAWHIFYIAFFALLSIVLLMRFRKKGGDMLNKTALILINIAFGMYVIDFFLMPLAYGEIDVEKLPFHACTAMCVMSFLSNHTDRLRRYRRNFALLGFISNLIYLIYPAGVMWHAVHPLSYRVVQTLIFHGVMSVYGFMVLVAEREMFELKRSYRDLALLVLMTVWALIGNLAYNSDECFYNWFFVVRDPFYAIAEDVAPFVMPFLNIAVFFGVEILIYLVIINKNKNKKVGA